MLNIIRKMKKLLSLCIILINITLSLVKAQQVESLNSIKLGIDGLHYSYEQKLARQITLNFEVGGSIGLTSEKVYFTPTLMVEPRLYYNLNKRFREGRFSNNSAGFFCLTSGIFLNSIFDKEEESSFFIVPKWGFRSSLSDHFIFEMMLGGGVLLNNKGAKFLPGINLRFGYVFN